MLYYFSNIRNTTTKISKKLAIFFIVVFYSIAFLYYKIFTYHFSDMFNYYLITFHRIKFPITTTKFESPYFPQFRITIIASDKSKYSIISDF